MIAIICLVYLALNVESRTTFTFSKQTGNEFVSFKRWQTAEAGTLSFYFKTTKKDAFLFYQQAHKESQFLECFLKNGKVELKVRTGRDGCSNSAKMSVPDQRSAQNLANGKWHNVVIKVQSEGKIALQVDNSTTEPINCGNNSELLPEHKLVDRLFVGGLDPKLWSDFFSNIWDSFEKWR